MSHDPVFRNIDEQFFHYMNALKTDTTLMDCLIAMQTAEGIDEATAEANAESCMLAVSHWDSVFGQVSRSSMEVMNRLLEKLARLEDSQRILALHQILFGLTAYDDPALAHQLDAGTPSGQLFQQHYEAILGSGNAPSAQELEEQIRQALSGYRISPVAMGMLAHQMRHGEGYLATAEALGEDGRNLKCLLTMEVWLQNRDSLTMAEAAGKASASVQTQAVADAVQRGYISRDVAKKLLIAIGIVVAVAGVIYLVHSMPAVAATLDKIALGPNPNGDPMSPLLKSILQNQFAAQHASALSRQGVGALMAFGGGALVWLSDKGADLISKLTVRFSHLFRKADEVHTAGMESIARETEADTVPQAREEVPATVVETPAVVTPAPDEDEDEPDYTFF